MSRHNPDVLPVTTNVLRLIVQSTFRGQLFENSFDYLSSVGLTFTPTLLQNFITAWQAANEVLYSNTLSDEQSITSYFCQDLNPADTPTQVKPVTVPGTVIAHTLPSFCAGVIQKGSVIKGQHGRGRMYMGALPSTFVVPATSPDTLSPAAVTAYGLLLTSLKVAIVSGGANWNWVITTRPIAPAYLVARYATIITTTIDSLLGTVRRRIEGRGR